MATKNTPFEFADLMVEPGNHANCELEIARLYTHSLYRCPLIFCMENTQAPYY